MNRTSTVLLLSFVLSFPALAQKKLAVVDLATPPTMVGLGAQVTRAVIDAAKSQGYQVIEPDAVKAKLGDDAYAQLLQCKGKAPCVAAKLSATGAQRAVTGSLDRDEKNYLVKLQLVDLATAQEITDVDRQILIASRRLTQDVNAAVPGLLRGEKEATGKLSINADAKSVQVTIDGEPAGTTPLTVELKPGKHSIHAEKKAYYAVDRYVTVAANQPSEEALRMVKIPGQVAEEDIIPELPSAPVAAAKAKPGVPHEALALGGAALVLAASGIGFYEAYSHAAQSEAYKNSVEGDHDKLYATVMLAGAAVAAVSAVVVGFTADGDTVTASASASPSGAGIALSGRF